MLAPLLHAAAISGRDMSELVRWLDARDFTDAIAVLNSTGATAAADQLEGSAAATSETARPRS